VRILFSAGVPVHVFQVSRVVSHDILFAFVFPRVFLHILLNVPGFFVSPLVFCCVSDDIFFVLTSLQVMYRVLSVVVLFFFSPQVFSYILYSVLIGILCMRGLIRICSLCFLQIAWKEVSYGIVRTLFLSGFLVLWNVLSPTVLHIFFVFLIGMIYNKSTACLFFCCLC